MNCQEAENLISARLAGELSPVDQASLDEHLAECGDCRAMYEALSAQHQELVGVFASPRLAAEDVGRRAMREIHQSHAKVSRFSWTTMIVSAAAGFAIAILLTAPWKRAGLVHSGQPRNEDVRSVEDVGRLSIATGPIEVLPPGESNWRALATGAAIEPQTRVRTPDRIRCEFVMTDRK